MRGPGATQRTAGDFPHMYVQTNTDRDSASFLSKINRHERSKCGEWVGWWKIIETAKLCQTTIEH